MKGRMNLHCLRQGQMDGRGIDNFLDGEETNRPGRDLTGLGGRQQEHISGQQEQLTWLVGWSWLIVAVG